MNTSMNVYLFKHIFLYSCIYSCIHLFLLHTSTRAGPSCCLHVPGCIACGCPSTHLVGSTSKLMCSGVVITPLNNGSSSFCRYVAPYTWDRKQQLRNASSRGRLRMVVFSKNKLYIISKKKIWEKRKYSIYIYREIQTNEYIQKLMYIKKKYNIYIYIKTNVIYI